MPLEPPRAFATQRDWDQWSRRVAIKPDEKTVGTAQIQDGAVTSVKLRNSVAESVIGRPQGTGGAPQDIPASADGTFLVARSGGLLFDAIADADIPGTLARDTEVTAAIAAALASLTSTGTFMPVVQGATTAGTATYASQAGNYTQINNRCLFNLRVKWSAATGTGNLRIAGLPLTSNSATDTQSAVFIFVNDANITDTVQGLIQKAAQYIEIDKFTVGAGIATYAVPAAGDLFIAGSYLL